jgi:flagellar biogenesis protein FliO
VTLATGLPVAQVTTRGAEGIRFVGLLVVIVLILLIVLLVKKLIK